MHNLSLPPHGQIRRLWMALMLIAAILLGSFQPTTTAHAEDGYAYYWSITFDFEDSAGGKLYVAVGHNENGAVQEPPIHAQTFDFPCRRVGNAGVSGGVLKLNGGYITCDVDIQRAIQSAFATCAAQMPGCHVNVQTVESYANFQAHAVVWSVNPGEAPIFYHPDAAYSISPQSSMTQITGALSPQGIIPSAALPAFPILGTWQNYTANYTCGALCQMQYTSAGGVQLVNTANAKVDFYTPSTTLYLGHNPLTGITAPAGTMIDYLFVDPPNHGNH